MIDLEVCGAVQLQTAMPLCSVVTVSRRATPPKQPATFARPHHSLPNFSTYPAAATSIGEARSSPFALDACDAAMRDTTSSPQTTVTVSCNSSTTSDFGSNSSTATTLRFVRPSSPSTPPLSQPRRDEEDSTPLQLLPCDTAGGVNNPSGFSPPIYVPVEGGSSGRLTRTRLVRVLATPLAAPPSSSPTVFENAAHEVHPSSADADTRSPAALFVPEPLLIRTSSFGSSPSSQTAVAGGGGSNSVSPSSGGDFRSRIATRPYFPLASLSSGNAACNSLNSACYSWQQQQQGGARSRVYSPPTFGATSVVRSATKFNSPPFTNSSATSSLSPRPPSKTAPRLHATRVAPAVDAIDDEDTNWSIPPDDFCPFLPPALQPPEHLQFVLQRQKQHHRDLLTKLSPKQSSPSLSDANSSTSNSPPLPLLLDRTAPQSLNHIPPRVLHLPQQLSEKPSPELGADNRRRVIIEACGGKQEFIRRMQRLYHGDE